jgi:UDP-glucose 4-epimerase
VKVLITGAAGLIGRASTQLLVENGHEVLGSDLRPAPAAIEHVRWQRLDIRRGEQLRAALLAFRPEAIVHLAARHFIPWCERYPSPTLMTNVVGSQNVIAAARAAGAGRLLFASSAAVYAPSSQPLAEAAPLAPDDVYGTSKMMGEQLLDLAAEGLDTVTLRLFNTIGPGDANAHLIPRIVAELRRGGGGRLRLGNLQSVRDYIHVHDVARAICAALERELPAGRTVINVGSGSARSVAEVVEAFGELLGRTLTVDSIPAQRRTVDRPFLVADIQRARQLLDWGPQVSFVEGLADVLRAPASMPELLAA